MADNSNDLDDLFMSDDSEKQQDDFADVFATDPSAPADSGPELDVAASSSISESNPFGESDGITDSMLADASVAVEKEGKKGKKAKKEKKEKTPKAPKVKKEKTPKAPKVKKEKAPKGPIVDKTGAKGVYVLLFVMIVALLLGNVVAFMTAGAACVTFLIIFDVLGLIALLVPFFLLSRLHKEPLSLFDMFLALAAIFAIVSCMAVLAAQASSYGSAVKAASNAPICVETIC